jgi:hypothetical protein
LQRDNISLVDVEIQEDPTERLLSLEDRSVGRDFKLDERRSSWNFDFVDGR